MKENNPDIKYGNPNSYNHKLDEERLQWLTEKTGRSQLQTQFLYDLCDGDFEKLKRLEVKIKTCHLHYCPGDKEAVEEVLDMEEQMDWVTLVFDNKVMERYIKIKY